jgi:hypothetical protein
MNHESLFHQFDQLNIWSRGGHPRINSNTRTPREAEGANRPSQRILGTRAGINTLIVQYPFSISAFVCSPGQPQGL